MLVLPPGHAADEALVACPCSQCRAGRLGGRIDLVAETVRVERVEGQGYGVQLVFSDGHERGIYPWAYLKALG
ncbi:gamma-butyrobetaine hydroxylase-like domain-containing protein [Pseudomonas alcaligenes]|uniref:DUF971 domain-containing protein n=1 Tax=Aquipseudomonas alcaligenes TaxID=43263 RepID=UPI002E7BBBD5|nr:gamma-butyrobetaine hydroxylase-like domain-containing protein [Pseudomonas alcaligenes]MEE1951642.1 gamma-butyrobetaine hydroxylase-like domain-containing protein [Pseudomonas alcaligenes]